MLDMSNNNGIIEISWESILALLLGFICLGGATFFPYHFRMPCIILAVVGTTFLTGQLYLTGYSIMWFIILAGMTVTLPFSYDSGMTLNYIIVYLFAVLFLCFPYSNHFWEKLLFVMRVFIFLIALSIIASTIIDNFVLNWFGFIVNPLNTSSVSANIQNELNRGYYSGLAGEIAQAALIMNVGIGMKFACFFSGEPTKKKDFVELVIYSTALILTGKRALFLIPILIGIIVFWLLKTDSLVRKKVLCILIGAIVLLAVLYYFIPQMTIMYERLIGNVGTDFYDPLSQRGDLWKYALQMFNENVLLGHGFGSYNAYIYDQGYLRNGQQWNYFAHNCYLQLLGEVGLIGTILFVGLFGYALLSTIRSINKSSSIYKKYYLIFSFYIQIMMVFYCMTGNVLYNNEQIILWFIAIAMSFYMKRGE